VRSSAAPGCSRRWNLAVVATTTLLILLQVYGFAGGIGESAARQRFYRLGKGAMLLINIVPDNPYVKFLGVPRPARLVETVNALNQMGYLHPPLIASSDAALIEQDNGNVSGATDLSAADPAGLIQVRGWAVYPKLGRSTDSVFLTYLDAAGHPIIFAAAKMGLGRPDLAGKLPASELPDCGWEADLDLGRIPPDTRTITLQAWVLDVDTGRATPLPGLIAISR
jgi:hypothetical protein